MGENITLQSIEVHEVRPQAADLRKIRRHSAERAALLPEITYLVKLNLAVMPPPDALGYELYIGDQLIRKYSQFKNGVYFKVADPAQLEVYRGQQVRFRRPGADEFIETNVTFPAVTAELSDAAPRARSLPTQDDVLRE